MSMFNDCSGHEVSRGAFGAVATGALDCPRPASSANSSTTNPRLSGVASFNVCPNLQQIVGAPKQRAKSSDLKTTAIAKSCNSDFSGDNVKLKRKAP